MTRLRLFQAATWQIFYIILLDFKIICNKESFLSSTNLFSLYCPCYFCQYQLNNRFQEKAICVVVYDVINIYVYNLNYATTNNIKQ